jgi:hypothetical protein
MIMRAQILAVLTASLVVSAQPGRAEPIFKRGEAPGETTLGGSTVTVPMEFWGARPVVSAKINGEGRFRFCLDLGTSVAAVVDDAVVKQAGITLPGDAAVPGLGEGGVQIEIEGLSIGDAVFSRVPASVADLDGMMPASMNAPPGILGMPFFEDCLLTLDFPGRRIRLESGELPTPNGEVMAYSAEGAKDYGVTLTLMAAGVPVKAHIDTGSPGFLTLLNEWQAKLPLKGKPRVVGRARTPMGETEVRAATLEGTLTLGPHEFADFSINFADLGPMKQFKAGNIGSRLLSEFEVTVDQKNKRVRFRRPGTEDKGSGNTP